MDDLLLVAINTNRDCIRLVDTAQNQELPESDEMTNEAHIIA